MSDDLPNRAEYIETLRLARSATMLALENGKQKPEGDPGRINNPADAAIMLYTDDPNAAALLFAAQSIQHDLEDFLSVSQVEGIAITTGERFPPDAFEAQRQNNEQPRIAAMLFWAEGGKCPRCRKRYRGLVEPALCGRCSDLVNG